MNEYLIGLYAKIKEVLTTSNRIEADTQTIQNSTDRIEADTQDIQNKVNGQLGTGVKKIQYIDAYINGSSTVNVSISSVVTSRSFIVVTSTNTTLWYVLLSNSTTVTIRNSDSSLRRFVLYVVEYY